MNAALVPSRPILVSERLRGEPVEKRHAGPMVEVLNEPLIYRYLSDDPPSLERLERQYEFLTAGKSPDGTEHWLTWILLPAALNSEPIGFVQATVKEPETAHVAYVLNPKHWRQGYASEAMSALLDLVFTNFRVECAIAEMDTRNQASIALVRSLGFRHLKTVQDVAEFKGSLSHEHVYEMKRSDWIQRASLATM